MLEIKDLNVFIDEKSVLKDINLKINEGEIHVLMGPNGVGKSTISKVIMGTDNYKVSGTILYNKLVDKFSKIIGFDIEKLNERTDDESMKLNN